MLSVQKYSEDESVGEENIRNLIANRPKSKSSLEAGGDKSFDQSENVRNLANLILSEHSSGKKSGSGKDSARRQMDLN